MTLVYSFTKPIELLKKLQREQNRLKEAAAKQDDDEMADHLFNLAVTAFHIKDWLKENQQGQRYSKKDVEDYVNSTKVLSACRDLCNSGKHFQIDRYVPKTQDVYASAGASMVIKILMVDGTKYEAVSLGEQAICAWESFFQRNGVG